MALDGPNTAAPYGGRLLCVQTLRRRFWPQYLATKKAPLRGRRVLGLVQLVAGIGGMVGAVDPRPIGECPIK